VNGRGELSYLAPLGSENISAPYFKQCFFQGWGSITPQTESNTTPPSPKTEITNILFYVLNFASIIKFKTPAEIVGSNPTRGMDICLL